MKKIAVLFLILACIVLASCEKSERRKLEETLIKTIFEYQKGRIANRIEAEAGYKIKIKKITISRIFKKFYNYKARVVFEEKKVEPQKNEVMSREQIRAYYAAHEPFAKVFYHLEVEDRWILITDKKVRNNTDKKKRF